MRNNIVFFFAHSCFCLILVLSTTSCLQKNVAENRKEPIINAAQANNTSNVFPIKQAEKRSTLSAPKFADKQNSSLVCSPKQLRQGSVLTLTMKLPHGGYLEIITPRKRYLFLSELDGSNLVEDGKKAGATPFFAASDFAKLSELKLNIAEATTADYDKSLINDKYLLSKVFIEPGKYKILLSLNSFEQDDPIIEGRCEIELVK